jgi:DNA-binding MarR family transcriptional regulator
MNSKLPGEHSSLQHRRRLTVTIKRSLRELRNQLSMLNRQIGNRVDLKDVDLDCFDLISRYGPLSPTALAQRAGLHPATMTGILDRLERNGWIARDRVASDRRAVLVHALRDRTTEMVRLYAGMNLLMDQVCAGYRDAELDLIADFLQRTIDAGCSATDELAGE